MDYNDAISSLKKSKEWAQERLDTGVEPPWSWYQLMKLVEAVDFILAARDTSTTDHSLELPERPGGRLQLVGEGYLQNDAQPRPDDPPIQLPM